MALFSPLSPRRACVLYFETRPIALLRYAARANYFRALWL
jgi:hypothetical protein